MYALRPTLTDQPILEWTILPILPVFLLCEAYLTKLVPPDTVPPLSYGHFKEIVTDGQKLSDLAPLARVRPTT